MTKGLNMSTEGLFKKLADSGLTFNIKVDKVDYNPNEDSLDEVTLNNLMQQTKFEVLAGTEDEETYEEGEPFDLIAKKMTPLVPSGKIKKRTIRQGKGDKPQAYAHVSIHYNAYIEYQPEPFDSTYTRKKTHKFTLNNGEIIPGVDLAVQSMELYEKAHFLIDPDYAYRNCINGRIPPNSVVLFEIELLEIVDSGASVLYDNLPKEQQKQFAEIYKYSYALGEKAKNLFQSHNLKDAIKNFNMASAKLDEDVLIDSQEDITKHRELKLRLYSNLLVCYTMLQEYRKGCAIAQKIYDLTNNGELEKISAKTYFNHAKCLRKLSEYDEAKIVLKKASFIEPTNPVIVQEFIYLDKDIEEHKKTQEIFAKALIQSSGKN